MRSPQNLRLLLSSVLLLSVGCHQTLPPAATTTAATKSESAELSEVRAPLEAYLSAHKTGDPKLIMEIFLPTAHIEGIRDGVFKSFNRDEYAALFVGPHEDELQRTRKIDNIDVSGSAATARVTLISSKFNVTDFLLLLKIDGSWKIANKIYFSQPR
jgi:hypothetical protein